MLLGSRNDLGKDKMYWCEVGLPYQTTSCINSVLNAARLQIVAPSTTWRQATTESSAAIDDIPLTVFFRRGFSKRVFQTAFIDGIHRRGSSDRVFQTEFSWYSSSDGVLKTGFFRRSSSGRVLQAEFFKTEFFRRSSSDGVLQTGFFRRGSPDGVLRWPDSSYFHR